MASTMYRKEQLFPQPQVTLAINGTLKAFLDNPALHFLLYINFQASLIFNASLAHPKYRDMMTLTILLISALPTICEGATFWVPTDVKIINSLSPRTDLNVRCRSKRDDCRHCTWMMRTLGPCRCNQDNKNYDKCYPWDKD